VTTSGTLTFVIINPVSGPASRGTAERRVQLATDALDAVGLRAEIFLTESEGHASDLARHAVGAGADLVIAWGGDGTINEVGRTLAFSETALGIVPAGSGNGLARELGIPFSPRAALSHALTKPVREIDAAEIEGRLFFNVAGIGLDALVAERVSRKHHAHGGLRRYIIASSRELMDYTPVEYTIHTDTDTFSQTALVVVIANSRQYGYGACIAPTASFTDGELDLVIIEDRGLAGNLLRMPSLLTGRLHRRSGVIVRKVKAVTITSAAPMDFHVDGEAFSGGVQLSAQVRPAALRVRA
jgi:YegS/Rv2252/BmrU family lipid kinase